MEYSHTLAAHHTCIKECLWDSIFPLQCWQSCINAILNCLSSRKYCEAIMDDLLLFTPNKQTHFEKFIDLLWALCKNGLKISPKKCQLFRTELQYMDNIIFIKEKKSTCETIEKQVGGYSKFEAPNNSKCLQKFCWCSELLQAYFAQSYRNC